MPDGPDYFPSLLSNFLANFGTKHVSSSQDLIIAKENRIVISVFLFLQSFYGKIYGFGKTDRYTRDRHKWIALYVLRILLQRRQLQLCSVVKKPP